MFRDKAETQGLWLGTRWNSTSGSTKSYMDAGIVTAYHQGTQHATTIDTKPYDGSSRYEYFCDTSSDEISEDGQLLAFIFLGFYNSYMPNYPANLPRAGMFSRQIIERRGYGPEYPTRDKTFPMLSSRYIFVLKDELTLLLSIHGV